MRISYYLNHRLVHDDVHLYQTALDFLRERHHMTGTREVCNEGDCGACAIAIGQPTPTGLQYRAFNSCLYPAVRLHGKHVVTVEGLAGSDALHPIQHVMCEERAVQCGFCTSGIILSLFCLFSRTPTPTREEILLALDGSLCRCTGYAAILKAAQSLSQQCKSDPALIESLNPFDVVAIAGELNSLERSDAIPADSGPGWPAYAAPTTLSELFSLLSNAGAERAQLLGGGTDVMVDVNLKGARPESVIDLARIRELTLIEEHEDGLRIGSGVTLSDVLQSRLVFEKFPALSDAVRQMCSTPVRNSATLAGNVCTASPIADTLPPLIAYNAAVIQQSANGTRRTPVAEFLQGYRKIDVKPHEIVAAIEIPFTSCLCSFEKTGKRRTLDIASVNSALAIQLDDGRLTDMRFVLGGVAPVPVLAVKTSAHLRGKTLSESAIHTAVECLRSELSPISDVRGSAEFRLRLAGNHLVQHFSRLMPHLFK